MNRLRTGPFMYEDGEDYQLVGAFFSGRGVAREAGFVFPRRNVRCVPKSTVYLTKLRFPGGGLWPPLIVRIAALGDGWIFVMFHPIALHG